MSDILEINSEHILDLRDCIYENLRNFNENETEEKTESVSAYCTHAFFNERFKIKIESPCFLYGELAVGFLFYSGAAYFTVIDRQLMTDDYKNIIYMLDKMIIQMILLIKNENPLLLKLPMENFLKKLKSKLKSEVENEAITRGEK